MSETYDFRMVRPVTITDAMLVSCTVPEVFVTVYSAVTTYGAGDIRGVTTGTSQKVYLSLQAGNLNKTPASEPTWWRLLGTVYAAYNAGTTYAAGDIVSSISTDSHLLYESVVGGNLGQALTDIAKWTALGRTNRHKMFDKSVNSQTSAAETLSFVITPGLVNTVTLLNVTGASATVAQSLSGYSSTKSLVRHEVLNWYDFYYEEPIRTGDCVFDDVPPSAASSLTITVDNPGGDAALGICLVGKSRTIGSTQWGFTGGVHSYSTSTESAAGDITMVRRANVKRLNFEVMIPYGFESEAFRILSAYTDVETVFILSSEYSMGLAYGFLGPWTVPVSDTGDTAKIEVKNLT